MALKTDADTLGRLWSALKRPEVQAAPLSDAWRKFSQSGWAYDVDLQDAIELADRRLAYHPVEIELLAKILELPRRYVVSRPEHQRDDPTGFLALAAPDAASVLILLERLGFLIDPEGLCSQLRASLRSASHLTFAETDVLFHDRTAGRLSPISICADDNRDWEGETLHKLKTAAGYRVEYAENGQGKALWLRASAPRYRKRPEPTLTTCPECGSSWVKGLPAEDKAHREMHRIRMAVLEPRPHRLFMKARQRDGLTAPWVDHRSPRWKHELMYRRAFAFKREFGYSFSQWSLDPAHDPEPEGFLFSDDAGRVIGAAAFRPQPDEPRPWRLDWIWFAPDHRRQGHLSREWGRLTQRFGIFDLTPPVSEAMQAFLKKQGWTS